jgi:outer membrane biosynthesis protein TonB
MAKIDINLDACQLSSDLLMRLRKLVRDSLRATHGKKWEDKGIPAELHDVLAQRQAREASITWNLSDSVDLLDFAGYTGLYDIIAAAPDLQQRFLSLAPDASVLRLRFLELDAIMNRIAYARPVSEADLGLLVSFEERLKRTAGAPAPAVEVDAAPAPRGETARPARAAATVTAPPPAPTPAPVPAPAPAPNAAASEQPIATAPPPPEPAAEAANEAEPETAPAAGPAPIVGPQQVTSALERGDSTTVLTALYQEVTALADGLWNGSVTALQARTWETVRESPWYREHFVRLNLRPISDFFGLVETAREKARAGASRNDLQEFLKEHSFVQVLMALKDLFRQHVKR